MKKNSRFLLIAILQLCFIQLSKAQSADQSPAGQSIDLAGKWSFEIDSLDKGENQQWYNRQLNDKISLPGSMTTNGKGNDITLHTPWTGDIVDSTWFRDPQYARYRQPGKIKVPFWLQPVKYYKGAAWYQKTVNIPVNWKNKYIELFIERSHWETKIWIDGKPGGIQNSLATAHVFQLSEVLSPGKHTITVRVDNRVKDFNVGANSHSISDHTQSNWNGMIGKLLLKARPAVYISDVQLFPDVRNKLVKARVFVNKITNKPVMVKLKLWVTSDNAKGAILKALSVSKQVNKSGVFEVVYPMGEQPLLWSEFTPDLYKMSVNLTVNNKDQDVRSTVFGMREFASKGTQFSINGQLTFLRGTLECAAFPKTGYPPTDMASWLRIFKINKSYGLNHLRFHSWCPPEAAFQAADQLGMYLQIECSSWANQGAVIGDGRPLDKYIYEESRRIVKDYGNHPSFCMLAYGNEPAGKNHVNYLTNFVKYWKEKDTRRLYTTGAGWPIVDDASNYNSTAEPRIQRWEEGLKSVINSKAPKSDYDWREIIKKWKHPTVSHEIGQWCVYPDFEEIAQYDGVLKAKNFEIFKDKLEENGMGKLARDFLYASGKLQVLCYKADIEAALRTPGFGGFQLLGLYDFPGQGTALVGVLNPFWKDKGYVTAAEYSQFCNAVVPLVRLPKMIYLNNEQLSAPVEIAQFGPSVLSNVTPLWKITDENGAVLMKGALPKASIPFGNGIKLGSINASLSEITKPSRVTLTVEVAGYKNCWDIFVYPASLPSDYGNVTVAQTLDAKTMEILNNGGNVLLTYKKGTVKAGKGGEVAIGFSSIFWNTAWTNHQPPVTLGVLCDPAHPALKEFPTQKFSNWQWWDAMSHANAIRLDALDPGLKPIVRVIDDWVTAKPLGLIFECKVGKGKLIVSGIDLLTDTEKRPEARQLLHSLKRYMNSNEFSPDKELSVQTLTALVE